MFAVPFPNPYFMPNPLMAAAAVNSQRMAAPAAPQPKPPEKPPVTTVFVGNITEKCGNELIRSILSECGAVATWKRIQGSNGKFQAFGFCEFESPFGTMRALRILHDYQLAEKKLVVKVDYSFLHNPSSHEQLDVIVRLQMMLCGRDKTYKATVLQTG
ncbi:RNA-binding protein 25 [Toxocara canis]|uniref:RNA-binding protein 25 n=1 Tax=Toxocara canis TaxID=6265 RepID=A0A0B2UQ22_TOXCA|nr:RNA-binding protein 25 [Toxocara canis]